MSDQALSHCTFSLTSPLYIPTTNTTSSTKIATNARIITALRNAEERAPTRIAPTPAAQHTVCRDACKEDCGNARGSPSVSQEIRPEPPGSCGQDHQRVDEEFSLEKKPNRTKLIALSRTISEVAGLVAV